MRILIADDHDIVRMGLVALLDVVGGKTVVGEVCDGIAAVAAVERLRPDILILDKHMPRLGGIEAARQVAALKTGCQVVMLTMSGDLPSVRRAFQAGIRAYVLKDNVQTEIFAALDALGSGRVYLSPRLGTGSLVLRARGEGGGMPATEDVLARLTNRERLVFFAVVQGLTSKQIAQELSIGKRTVDTHRKNMMDKLGVPNKDKLLRLAFEKGLVDLSGAAW